MTADERRTLRAAVDARRREVEGVPAEAVPLTRAGRPATWLHGSERGYRDGCRCDDCRAVANAARAKRRRQPNVSVHGYSGYSNGCRCDTCRTGNRLYDRQRPRREVA